MDKMFFYEASLSDDYQDLVFDDGPEDKPWEQTYDALLRDHFGKLFDQNYRPFRVIPNPDNKKKRTGIDTEVISNSVILMSERAVNALEDLLIDQGQFLKIDCPWNGYIAFHVTTVLNDAVDTELSTYRLRGQTRVLRKPTFRHANVQNESVFMIEQSISRIFFSSAFKKRHEDAKLHGMRFVEENKLDAI